MFKRLITSKTAWTAVAGIATAIGAYFGDEIDVKTMVFAIGNGLAVLFLRDGMAKL